VIILTDDQEQPTRNVWVGGFGVMVMRLNLTTKQQQVIIGLVGAMVKIFT